MNQATFNPFNDKEARLKRAFKLAWFLHGDRALATQIAVNAYEKLEVVAIAQDKRLYYKAGKRSADAAGRPRRKVSLSELHLLQRLVLLESEPHERQREEALKQLPSPPSTPRLNAIMTVHYLKHLAQLTLNRNSFHITLGFSRLLFNFSTSETMEIYAALTQNSEPGPDDYYYRARKAVLIDELKDRFGEWLKVRRGLRGEERFEAQPDSSKFVELVQDCLQHLAPWDMACAVPPGYDAERASLPQLAFDGSSGDAAEQWHKVEIARMHTVINPECYERLVTGLGMAKPATRLDLPRFFLSQTDGNSAPDEPTYTDRGSGGGDPPEPPQLDSNDFQAMLRELAARAGRRRFSAAGLLRILVNGRAAAQLDLRQSSQTQIAINQHAQLIEVRAAQDDTLLAVFLPVIDEADAFVPFDAAVTLEGGQQISFALAPAATADAEEVQANVTISYRETALARAFALWRNRLAARWGTAAPGALGPVLEPALAFTLLALLSAALIYLVFVKPAPQDELARRATPTPVVSPSVTTTPTPSSSASASPSTRPTISDEVIVTDIRSSRSSDPSETLTRNERADAVGLLEAKKVVLEISGDEGLRQPVSARLTQCLQAGNKFSLTGKHDEADLALKVSVAAAPANQLSLTVRLVDAQGKVIWPLTPRRSGRKYLGAADKVADKFCADLLSDIQRAARQRNREQ